jgi:hypothetical protein
MREHLDELPPPRSSLDIIVGVLSKLDNIPFNSPEERGRRALALLSLENRQIVESIPMPRAIR